MSKNILEIKHYTKIYSDNKKAVDDLHSAEPSGLRCVSERTLCGA